MFNKGWNNLLPGVTSFQLRVSPWWDQTVIKWIYLSKTLSVYLSMCLSSYRSIGLNSGETESLKQLRPPDGGIVQLLWSLAGIALCSEFPLVFLSLHSALSVNIAVWRQVLVFKENRSLQLLCIIYCLSYLEPCWNFKIKMEICDVSHFQSACFEVNSSSVLNQSFEKISKTEVSWLSQQ